MYKISFNQLESVVDYLATKPYGEVHELVKMLINLERDEAPVAEEVEETSV